MQRTVITFLVGTLLAASAPAIAPGYGAGIEGQRDSAKVGDSVGPVKKNTIRIGATQPRSRLIDYKLGPAEALAMIDQSLNELEQLVHKAGKAGCDVVVFPEDTLGTLHWEQVHKADLKQVLPVGVNRMLDRLGTAGAGHNIYVALRDKHVGGARGVRHKGFPP